MRVEKGTSKGLTMHRFAVSQKGRNEGPELTLWMKTKGSTYTDSP